MLVHEFSSSLSAFSTAGTFGVAEFDEDLVPLNDLLVDSGVDPVRRLFYLLLSFVINQGTEWDAFAIQMNPDGMLYSVLEHGRKVLAAAERGADLIVLRRPAIRNRAIELLPTFHAITHIGVVRAPAICFLALDKVAFFRENAAALKRNVQDGQAYAFLLRLDIGDVDKFLAEFKLLFEPFTICFWLNASDGRGGKAIITMLTVRVTPYEI